MSSTGAGLSGNFPGIGDKSVDHPHADAQAVDFSQGEFSISCLLRNNDLHSKDHPSDYRYSGTCAFPKFVTSIPIPENLRAFGILDISCHP